MLKTVSELREYRIVGCLMTPTFSRQYYSMTATCLDNSIYWKYKQ